MDAQIILALVSQGMRLWADYADRAAKGELTAADVDAMAATLGADIDALRADIAAQRAAP